MDGTDDLEGYRQARSAEFRQNRAPLELDSLVRPFQGALNGDPQAYKPLMAAGGGCCCLLLILLSVGSLTPLQVGLTVNSISRQVDQESMYHGGRHFIMPWNSFIAFPSTQITVSFDGQESGYGALQTRTKDGLALQIQLAFQYRIMTGSLGKLYSLANLQYEPLFVRNARDVLLKAAADYEAFEYWQSREKIGAEMKVLLDKRLTQTFANCGGLQILIIDLPEEFETSIVQTQITEQMQKTKQNDQQARRIEADTEVLKASYTRNVTVTRNGADALWIQSVGIAKAEAQQKLLEVEASTMSQVQKRLKLTGDQMVLYQQFMTYHQLENASFVYGLGNAMLNLPR